jgi:glycerol-3-phosphate acyltransferase PlsY
MFQVLLWTAIGFVSGSLPFSVWLGRRLLRKDITQYGDANPGATNVLRAGGKQAGALALLLDTLKALIPVGLAYYWVGITDWGLVPVALAPIAGHAFSPFLGFNGGKAVATTLGVWMALTIWEGPTVGGLLVLLFTKLFGANGWAVLFAMIGMLIYFVVTPEALNGFGVRPSLPILVTIWAGNFLILAYKHRADLAQPPRLRRSTPHP